MRRDLQMKCATPPKIHQGSIAGKQKMNIVKKYHLIFNFILIKHFTIFAKNKICKI